MDINNEMIFVSNDGKETKARVIATFDINDNKYIAYTDGTMSDDGEELYVSKYTIENGNLSLIEITSEYEWKQVDKYLDDYVFIDED